ncbi:tetratricopeptide repeat protein [Candidatus Peregrinibacteria bacterium]|nr:tetratricopeptide repeat protein [Candidatus Peregrinibacteria bacterium]
MKNPKYLLRLLQILTGITIIAIIAMIFGLFGGKAEKNNFYGQEKLRATATKIKRPRLAKNSTYKELIENGDKSFYLKNLDDALFSYQKASELEPREALPYEKIGDIYFLQKNYASAKENFNLALSIDPEKSGLNIKIVRALFGQRKILDAQAALEKITKPTQQSMFYQGILAAFLNKQEQAKELLGEAKEMGPDENVKSGSQKILNIYRDFELEKDGKIEHLQTFLAQAFDQLGEYGLAIELAFDALKTKNDYRDAWIVLGHAFLNEQKMFDAQDSFTKAINLDSNHPSAFFYRGIARKNLKKTEEATADLKETLKLGFKPQIIAKFELAENLFELKRFSEAFTLYKDVVMTDPSDITRFIRPIALAINHLNQPQQALELAEKAFLSHSNTAMAYNLSGWAYIAMKDFAKARQNLEQALKLDSKLAAAHLNLGQLEQAQNNNAEAIKHYEKAVLFAENSEDFLNVGVWNTAKAKIEALQKNEPQTEKIMPSLTLE